MKSKIVFRFAPTNFYTRWPCHVCGGCTEKVSILCEVTDGKHKGMRICEECLRAGKRKVDARLRKYIAQLQEEAADLHSLVGRLEIPTYEAWRKADAAEDQKRYRTMLTEEEKARGRQNLPAKLKNDTLPDPLGGAS
jgi:hypothetical protein